jgi:cell division protein FtsQ
MTRAGIAAVWARRRLRIALLAVLIAVPLLGGVWLALRHSSLTAVEHVQVDGLVTVHGADAGAIEAALTGAAHGMSTLDVKTAALRAAVAPYPIVRSVRARASFPHGLRIEVVEQPPVAALVVAGARTAVAADGVVLGPGFLSSSLPLVNAGAGSTATATAALPRVGQSVRGASLIEALTVLGAAPAPLARMLTRVYSGTKGLTVVLRSGLLAYFGDGTRPHAKWIALTRVLADPSSAGAAYIDVRLPERPAAGFAPGTVRPGTGSTETESSSGSDPATAAELAAGLDAAVAGGSSSSAGSGSGSGDEPAPSSSTPSGEAGSAGSGASEATSAPPSQTGASAGAETPASSPSPGG